MSCRFCGEDYKTALVMRSEVVSGEVETFTICTSCLWERYFENKINNNEKLLPEKDTKTRRISPKSKSTYPAVGKKAN
jgi:hypothetical protein